MTDIDFLYSIVCGIVSYPIDIRIDRQVDEMGVLLILEVNKEDMGRIIGREGNTAKAVRTILKVFGMKANSRINLKILEPGETYQKKDFGSAKKDLEEAIEDL